MPDQSTPTVASVLTPELLQALADTVGAVLAKQAPPAPETTPEPAAPAEQSAPQPEPIHVAEEIGAAVAPLAAPLLAKVQNRYKIPNFWVALGTIGGLLAQNPLGLQLHPAAQVAIAGVAAVFMAAEAIANSSAKGGANG